MTTENTAVAPIDLTKAELQLSLSKEGLAYQTLLQQCEDVKFTRDNLNEERTSLINLRKVKSKLESISNPWTARWSAWNEARRSLVEPVAVLLTKKEKEFRKISLEIEEEIREAEAEKQRKAGILAEIDSFFINQSQAVAGAATLGELVRVQKLIGSHKAASRYGEYLLLVAQKASNLEKLIKVQKESIKILTALKGKEMALESIGDDEAVLALRELQEVFTAKLELQRIDVQETAISMAVTPTDGYVDVIAPAAPKPRRQTWAWEVNDDIISGEIMYRSGIKRVAKAMPSWVEQKIISKRVDDYLDARKAEGIEGDEFEHNGVRFFIKKSY